MLNTFGMCWSRVTCNENLLAKKLKDGCGAPVVEIQSTATKLLSAYLTKTNPLAPAKFFLVDMQYVTQSTLRKTSFPPDELEDINHAFQRYREILSLMARGYKAQDEVRLIVERDDLRDEKIVDNKFFAKRVDLGSVFTGLKLHGFNRAVAEKDFIDSYARTLNLNFEIVS